MSCGFCLGLRSGVSRVLLLRCLVALIALSALASRPASAQTIDSAVGDLAGGDSITFEFLVTVDQPVLPGTSQVCNQGTVAGSNFAPAVSTDDPSVGGASDPTCTPIDVPIDLVVGKTESSDPVIAGSGAGNLTYVVTVTNASADTATGVALSEVLTLPAGVSLVSATPSQGSFTSPTWTVGTLAPAGFATLTVVLTAGASAANGTDTICDTATVSAIDQTLVNTGDDSATECTSIARQIDLQLSKTESIDPVVAGSGIGNLTYVVTVANAGPSDASGIALSEVLTLPAGVSLVSVTPSQGSFASPTWTVGALATGADATLTVVLTAGPSAATGTDTICDTATVTAANETRILTGDDTITECTSILRQVDLQLSKTESIDPVVAGSGAGNLTYVVTVHNDGPSDASGVALSEALTLPAGVGLVSVTPSQGSFASPTWTVGALAAGASATLTAVLTAGPSTAPGSNVICDTATVTGANETLVNTGDDSATECTSVEAQADIVVTVSDSPDPATAGTGAGNLTYVVTITNAGPSDATAAVVSSEFTTLTAGVTIDSATPSQGGYAGTTWTVGTLAAGSNATLTFVLTVGAAVPVGPNRVCNSSALTALGTPQINPGNESEMECTAVAVAADLAITKDDDADPPAAGADLTYTLTVSNLGPSGATNVVVTDPLPAGVTYVSDTCGGSNVPPWTWNLGSLAAGSDVSCDVVVSIDPSPPASVSNTASVTADETDPVPGNNSDTETTTLDDVPPQVTAIDSVAATGGSLDECETATVAISKLLVTFDEPMDTVAVVLPANYQLIATGPDLDFSTTTCGGLAGDDVLVALPSGGVTYSAATRTATLDFAAAIPNSQYRLLVCPEITDLAGNQLDGDGDGTAGDAFTRAFRADAGNLFTNSSFDCTLASWSVTATGAGEFEWSSEDSDAAPPSGSAHLLNLAPSVASSVALNQCANSVGLRRFDLETRVRIDAAPGIQVGLVESCRFFSAPACGGSSLGVHEEALLLPETAGGWLDLHSLFEAPPPTASMRCSWSFETPTRPSFDAYLDQLRLTFESQIFTDGFESGDTSAWNLCVGAGCPP
jgi:uncharacterized repeat protein (TIGR01451 family)